MLHRFQVQQWKTAPSRRSAGHRRRRLSDYGTQLREKQKSAPLSTVCWSASSVTITSRLPSVKGSTGENLLQLLESRLDNVVYRMGFAASRSEARQLVVTRRLQSTERQSISLRTRFSPNDNLAVAEKAQKQQRVKVRAGVWLNSVAFVDWIDVDAKKMEGAFKAPPDRSDLPAEINE